MKMKTLRLEAVNEIRRLTKKTERKYFNFINEVEILLKNQKPGDWFKMPIDTEGIVWNDVWVQNIGKIKYHRTIHTFSYMYVPNQGCAIIEHGHDTLVHNKGNIKKAKELYIFYVPSSMVEFKFCGKDEMHELYNNYGCPVYVIYVRVTGRG